MVRIFILAIMLASISVAEAKSTQSSPPRQEAVVRDFGEWLGPYRAKVTAKMLEDFGEQYIYAPLNAALPAPAPNEQRVVFFGDSITDLWDLAKFFPDKPYINRGIGGQVTPQMVVRFHADVINLHPAAVVILAGVNDTHGVLQIETEAQIIANLEAMAEMAEAHGIKPIFTKILPMNNYTENAATILQDRHVEVLERVNDWLVTYCAAHHYTLIDYGPVLRDEKGLLRADFTTDGLHPNEAAYKLMAPIAQQAIEVALTTKAHKNK